MQAPVHDAAVIGGGFYGVVIAIYLARRGLRHVVLLEKEGALMTRASYNNQARLHNGCHYPRSFTTAYRSRLNTPRFVADWPDAVRSGFTHVYAIARRDSKVNARQFENFCRTIGTRIEVAPTAVRTLFDRRRVEAVYVVDEQVFDTTMLARWASTELQARGVEVRLGTRVARLSDRADGGLLLAVEGSRVQRESLAARYVFNCSYSGINQIGGGYPGTQHALKHELTEMALVQAPEGLGQLGITLMDGPFFSLMPFPARGLHTISHVRYTPHLFWNDAAGIDPYDRLVRYGGGTRFDRMLRDIERFLPAIRDTRYVESLFEVKTVLQKNETDDGRPILFENHASMPRCFSVLGGKFDNIYDVLLTLDGEDFAAVERAGRGVPEQPWPMR